MMLNILASRIPITLDLPACVLTAGRQCRTEYWFPHAQTPLTELPPQSTLFMLT